MKLYCTANPDESILTKHTEGLRNFSKKKKKNLVALPQLSLTLLYSKRKILASEHTYIYTFVVE